MESQLYTTPEASKETNIPESTIRSWLTRYPDIFQMNIHLVMDEHSQKLWTQAGIEMLRSRRGASKNATDDVANSDSETDATNVLESLLEESATQLAREYWRLLPGRVLHRIKQMRENPTPEERQIVTVSVRAAVEAGTEHLLLPSYQPMLLEGGDETD
ncbi:hypothetical protein [Nostoc sp. CCY0012]|uniref:hypothetical protein n=1 Tax=Nostoc sp. CCY0012 TaxID=1056123 RepID=UPI0039C62C6C